MDRQELVRNAVAFLTDSKTLLSPVSQRVQFLEAKGLTPQEIDLAFKQAAAARPYQEQYGPTQGPLLYHLTPPPPRWDWRDYFITAVFSGAVAYGAISLFKKYLSPHLQPPDVTAYEQDRDALNAQFDAAELLLKEIQTESAAVRTAVEEQRIAIEKTTKDVQVVVVEMREGEQKTRDEMREIRDEVNAIREMLPKMIEKNKESHNQSLAELQQELKSLKALLLSRGPSIPSTPSSPLPMVGRPTIPAWQLASGTANATENPAESGAGGKGKEVEMITQVVEGLANDADQLHGSRPATPQPADSALANLRKSIAYQRGQSPSPVPRTSSTGKKLSLEDRLRASLTTGDVSGTNSSKRATQSISDSLTEPDPPHDSSSLLHVPPPISPSLIPLPSSPPLSPVLEKPPENILTDDITQETVDSPTGEGTRTDQESSSDIESLQERLKQVEQRFLDVSESFKKLQANRAAADAVIQELTPLQTIQDTDVLRDYLKSLVSKSLSYQDEIKEFESTVQKQEERILELSEKHNVESRSQLELIGRLRSQIAEAEALFKASQVTSSKVQENVYKQKDEVQKLEIDLEQTKNMAKEEEEKRVKAISLLKTVRQKLVKTERERDEAFKEVTSLKQREQGDKDKGQADKLRLQEELNAAKADKEKTSNKIKTQFEKELVVLKERYEKELSVLKGQFELESVTLKANYTKELSLKTSQASTLEASLNNIMRDKNQMFDHLQMRQAEVESAQSHLESLQNQNIELQYQLREAQDRIALLTDNLQEAQREQETRSHQSTISPEEVARLLSSTELKYEQKLAEMKTQLRQVEIDRNDSEAEWNRKVRDKAKEAETLKNLLEVIAGSRGEYERLVNGLRAENAHLQEEVRLNQQNMAELLSTKELVKSLEKSAKEQEAEFTSKIGSLEQQIEEGATREAQLRRSNKTLREELRKIQSSIALLERQRSPGIGYWAPRADESALAEARNSISSIQSESTSLADSPTPAQTNEEEINLEYLRNVILQFLEHKEMRPDLVRVMSILLRFTPQETRRLMAKV